MRRYIICALYCAFLLMLCAGCTAKDDHSSGKTETTAVTTETEQEASSSDSESTSSATDTQTDVTSQEPEGQTDVLEPVPAESDVSYDTLEGYDYDVAADAETFDYDNVDIAVGDNLYMTQINDWFTNFSDYEGKTVEIEGYFIVFDPYTFVGRYGPTCPYCTGGYVDFEFHGLESMLSGLISGQSWIRVYGILRQGQDITGTFYYIEAVKVELLDEVGIDTVTN